MGSEEFVLKVEGQVKLEIFDEKGNLKDFVEEKNVVTQSLRLLAAELFSAITTVPGITHLAMGVGDGTPSTPPTPTSAQTLLESEIVRVAATTIEYVDAAGTPIAPQDDPDGDGVNQSRRERIHLVFDFAAGVGTGLLKEMGMFGGVAASSANKGTMANFFTFAQKNKTASDTMKVTWQLRFIQG